MRPLTIPERRAIDRRYPRIDYRASGFNKMVVALCIMVAAGGFALLRCGGPT